MDYLIVDICTQHTSLCSMNVIFICVIVLDKICFHMLNLCWFKHKKIFEYFSCFWKVFCFYKNWKFQKLYCPILATQSRVRQVACHSRELTGRFWRLVCKWKVESRRVHRDFHGSACNSLASKSFQSRKTHRRFFKNLVFKVFRGLPWRLASNLVQSQKSRVLHIEGYLQGRFQKLFIFSLCIIITIHTFISCPLFSLGPLSIRVKKGESILFLMHICKGRNSLYLSFYYLLYLEGLMCFVQVFQVTGINIPSSSQLLWFIIGGVIW